MQKKEQVLMSRVTVPVCSFFLYFKFISNFNHIINHGIPCLKIDFLAVTSYYRSVCVYIVWNVINCVNSDKLLSNLIYI